VPEMLLEGHIMRFLTNHKQLTQLKEWRSNNPCVEKTVSSWFRRKKVCKSEFEEM